MYNLTGRKITSWLCLTTLLMLFIPAVSFALETQEGKYIQVAQGEKIKGPAFYGGEIIQIDGTVDGTAFAGGREVRINGDITGDLFAAGEEVTVSGKIHGNLYTGAKRLIIKGEVEGDVLGAGETVNITTEASLQRDLLVAGRKVAYEGSVARQILAGGQNIIINGRVGDDARIQAETVELQNQAAIAGDLLYKSPAEAKKSGAASVAGKTDWTKTEMKPAARGTPAHNTGRVILGILWSLASSLLIWFLITLWRPSFWEKTRSVIAEQPLKTLGVGALVLMVTPIVAIILLVTVIGIPLGILLGVLYAVTLYFTKIIAAVFIGYWLAQRFSWPEIHKGVWFVLLGLAVIALLGKVPFLGFLMWLVILFAGLGAIFLSFASPEKPV